MENKWEGLQGPGYRIINLGRPAVFLIPSHKLRQEVNGGLIETRFHRFLIEQFGSYTMTILPYFGYWRGEDRVHLDECRQYEVSFEGKEKIPVLAAELAKIALLIGEECIYFKAGQYTSLIYPEQSRSQEEVR